MNQSINCSTYFNILAPFLRRFDFFPFDPFVKESFESESEFGIIAMVEFLSRSSCELKEEVEDLSTDNDLSFATRSGFYQNFIK